MANVPPIGVIGPMRPPRLEREETRPRDSRVADDRTDAGARRLSRRRAGGSLEDRVLTGAGGYGKTQRFPGLNERGEITRVGDERPERAQPVTDAAVLGRSHTRSVGQPQPTRPVLGWKLPSARSIVGQGAVDNREPGAPHGGGQRQTGECRPPTGSPQLEEHGPLQR